LTTTSNKTKLIDRCLKWLEAPFAEGPNVALNVPVIDFGDVLTGKYKNIDLEITNSGESTLELRKFEISGTDKDYFNLYSGGLSGTRSMAPGVKHTATIRFLSPPNLQTDKDYTAYFDISTNVDTDSIFKVLIKARGVTVLGVDENNADDQLLKVSIAPNPVNSKSIITYKLEGYQSAFISVNLIDATGKTVKSLFNDILQPGLFNQALNTDGLSSGSYYLVVKSIFGNYMIQLIK
jgi:hypothetical protein